MSSRATYGKVTNMVASTMPGTAKMIAMSRSCSQCPNQPWTPNSITSTRPATTGETANGRSISVMSRLLPRNSNFAMAQAAQMPNTVFTGTTIAAVSSVSRIEASVSGSVKLVAYASSPFARACASTAPSGAISSSARNAIETKISSALARRRASERWRRSSTLRCEAGHLSSPGARERAGPRPARG